MSLNFLEDGIDVIRKRSKRILLAVSIVYLLSFFLGFASGIYLRDNNFEEASNLLKTIISELPPVSDYLFSGQFIFLGVIIFLYNLRTMFLFTLSGLIFLPAFFLLLSEGSLVGLIFGITSNEILLQYNSLEIVAISIIFILEFLALVLASTEGLYLGASVFFPKKIYKKKVSRKKAFFTTLGQTIRVYIIIALLLLLAAIIETTFLYFVSLRALYP